MDCFCNGCLSELFYLRTNSRISPMQVNPLHPVFAAELVGADLTSLPDAELVRTVEDAMAQYGVLAIRDAEISDEQQKQFSRAFGPLEFPSRYLSDGGLMQSTLN